MAPAPYDLEQVDVDTAVIALHAKAGTRAGTQIAALLTELKAQGVRRFVVDLRAPDMLNSKVLDALVRGAADLDPRTGAGLVVITAQQYVRAILQITETGGLLLLAESRDEALEALPARPGGAVA